MATATVEKFGNREVPKALYPTMRPERMMFLIAACMVADRAVWLHGNSGIGKSQMSYACGRDQRIRAVSWGKWLVANGFAPDDTVTAWMAWEMAYGEKRPDYMPETEFPFLEIVHLTIPQHEPEDFVGVPKHNKAKKKNFKGLAKKKTTASVAMASEPGADEVLTDELAEARAAAEFDDWVTSWAPVDVFRRGVPVILFLDEVSAAESRTQKVLMQLVQERRIANVSLAEGTVILLAGNLAEDRAQLKSTPFPLGNRCAHFILKISVESWLTWAEKEGLPGLFRAWVKERQMSALHAYDSTNPSLAQLTPRSLAGAAMCWKAAVAFGDGTKDDLEDLIYANIGTGKGTEILAFMDLSEKMATWAQIVRDPNAAKLPEQNDLSMLYYTSGMLLDHLIKLDCAIDEIRSAVIYAERVFKANKGMMDAGGWMIGEIMKLLKTGRSQNEKKHGMDVIDAISEHSVILAEKAGTLLSAVRKPKPALGK